MKHSLFHKFKDISKRYKNLSHRIQSKISFKETLIIIGLSLLITAILFSVPVLIVFNLFIFSQLKILLGFLSVLVALTMIWVYQYIYYFILVGRNDWLKPMNIKLVYFYETILYSAILVIFGLLILIFV